MYLNKEKDLDHENVLVFNSEKVLTDVSSDKSRYRRDTSARNKEKVQMVLSLLNYLNLDVLTL